MFVLFLLIFFLAVAGALVWYTQYWQPRVSAFRNGRSRVPIWFGQGELILWNPGQTFAFLCNKKLVSIGETAGGYRAIYSYKGEEAVGPIQMQSALFNWEDANVLTRDGQPLKINIGVWWKVDDPEKYVFHIYSDQATDVGDGNTFRTAAPPPPGIGDRGYTPQSGRERFPESTANSTRFDATNMHRIADQWLRVVTESTVRARINTLTVAEVVSAHAMQFLQQASDGQPIGRNAVHEPFEEAIRDVLGEIQRKALDFGLQVERLEVQHVYLPQQIQDAINETRIAFLAPIRGEREAEAVRIKLEKLVSVLGRENVGLNEIMKNFQNANFVTPMPLMQPLVERMTRPNTPAPGSLLPEG
jgi:regulator of protease activity HflC (stomatin/prohibitin superfamily)